MSTFVGRTGVIKNDYQAQGHVGYPILGAKFECKRENTLYARRQGDAWVSGVIVGAFHESGNPVEVGLPSEFIEWDAA